MKNIQKVTRVMALAVLVAAGIVGQAEAATITLSPASTTANVGDAFSVLIDVSGLTEAVGGFSAVLSFDDTVLVGSGYTIGAGLFPATGLDGSFGFAAGGNSPLDLYFTSFESGAILSAAQGAGFTLATINFTAASAGFSPLTLSGVVLSNAAGDVIATQFTNGDVCVGCATQVPEPASLLLLGSGLATIAARKRFAKARG